MWARLYDGRMVYENLKQLLSGFTSPNLLNNHPPFQIDGNLGGTEAVAEALMQSCTGEINLLPALPEEWSEGHIYGLRAKGGFEVNIEWSECRLSRAEIRSELGGECRVRANSVVSVSCGGESVGSHIESGVIVFDTAAGKTYTLQ